MGFVVRLLRFDEREKADNFLNRLHYLGATGGGLSKALRYVAEDERSGEWLALLDWGYGSLKNSARDLWIGWDHQQKTARLKYVVTNTRFLILPEGLRIPNFASQVLSRAVKRLSDDWAVYHGHHLLLAETFIDSSRFKGTCYKAANWTEVGETSGFGRSNKRYFEHGQKKKVLLYPLHRDARKILTSDGFPHPFLFSEGCMKSGGIDLDSIKLSGKHGLLTYLQQVTDYRCRQGLRYELPALLALTVCAVLTGVNSILGIAEYGRNLSEKTRRALGLFRGQAPDDETLRMALNKVDTEECERAIQKFLWAHYPSHRRKLIAIDGKCIRGARTADSKAPCFLSAVLHHEGIVIASRQIPDKTNEIPEARELLAPLDIRGSLVTLDAIHTQTETAKFIVEEKHADYLLTVKDNQLELHKALSRLPEGAFSPSVSNNS